MSFLHAFGRHLSSKHSPKIHLYIKVRVGYSCQRPMLNRSFRSQPLTRSPACWHEPFHNQSVFFVLPLKVKRRVK